jgi:hypothetical protein
MEEEAKNTVKLQKDHGGSDGGDQKKQKKKEKSPAKQWADEYHQHNPVDLKKFPRVEYWNDIDWEPYKEDIQEAVHAQIASDGADLKASIEWEIDLDDGNSDWKYMAHMYPVSQVPADIVDPIKEEMMEKAVDPNLFTKYGNIWICGYQGHDTKKNKY